MPPPARLWDDADMQALSLLMTTALEHPRELADVHGTHGARNGEREPAPMRHGMAQARDVARMLNAELEKPRPPVERDPRVSR